MILDMQQGNGWRNGGVDPRVIATWVNAIGGYESASPLFEDACPLDWLVRHNGRREETQPSNLLLPLDPQADTTFQST